MASKERECDLVTDVHVWVGGINSFAPCQCGQHKRCNAFFNNGRRCRSRVDQSTGRGFCAKHAGVIQRAEKSLKDAEEKT